jgi:nucleoside-diphosphate-sugar epimerase
MRNYNILITGGAGYLGSVMVPLFLKKKYNVTVLDNFMFEQSSLLSCCHYKNFSVIKGDCRDKNLMKGLIKKSDFVVHLAAYAGIPFCEKDKFATNSVNFDSVKMICSLLSKDQPFIFPVSNCGYKNNKKFAGNQKLFLEKDCLYPTSTYGKTKANAEIIVMERENSITFRLATVFGVSPRMRIDLLVNDFVYRAVNDRSVTIFEGHFKRNYIHVQDISRLFQYSLKKFDKMKNEIYNIGLDKENVSKIELCKKIKLQIPNFYFSEAPINKDPDQRNYLISHKKILKTGFKPKWSLNQGIKELIKSYKMILKKDYINI